MCREHGYLKGEEPICPICGQSTEVYSRITGYYRPVQNWNDGKAQEYKDRTVYSILDNIVEKNNHEIMEEIQKETTDETNKTYLFVTESCPNCSIARSALNGISYELIYAEKNANLCKKFGVMQAPTLISINDGIINRYQNTSEIVGFAKGLVKSI